MITYRQLQSQLALLTQKELDCPVMIECDNRFIQAMAGVCFTQGYKDNTEPFIPVDKIVCSEIVSC